MKNQFTYFKDCKNLNDVKTTFRKLSKIHHPDLGGNVEIMKIINNEYDIAFTYFQKLDNEKQKAENIKNNKKENYNFNYENSAMYKNIIEKLIRFELKIEIIGSWVWIEANKNTYSILNLLHELKFTYSKNKKSFYWFDGIEKQSGKYRGYYNKNQLRDRFGLIEIESNPSLKLQ